MTFLALGIARAVICRCSVPTRHVKLVKKSGDDMQIEASRGKLQNNVIFSPIWS